MKITYLKTEHTFFNTVIKITNNQVLECNKDDILTNDFDEIEEGQNAKIAFYFKTNEKCTIITKEEFDETFIKTVEKINEISKL